MRNDERNFMQHGTTDCFTHSICVAYMALRVAKALHFKNINQKVLFGEALAETARDGGFVALRGYHYCK